MWFPDRGAFDAVLCDPLVTVEVHGGLFCGAGDPFVFSCVYVRSTLDGSMDLLIPVKHDGNCRIQVYIMRTFSHQMPQSCSGRHLFRCRCSRTSRRWDLAWLVGMRKRSKVPCWSTRLCDRLTLRSRLRGEKERGQRRVCQIWISSSAECCQP